MSWKSLILAIAASTLTVATNPAIAQQQRHASKPVYYGHWMHKDVNRAWSKGFYGQGAKVTVIDNFATWDGIKGNLKGVFTWKPHGGWTSQQVQLIAPSARVIEQQHSGSPLKLQAGFNVLNLSYSSPRSVFEADAYKTLNDQGKSIVDHARKGAAVVVKAAGNASRRKQGIVRPVGKMGDTTNDAMALALKGSKSVIFVGALDKHGSRKDKRKAKIASYSNVAGKDKAFNSRFVVVGVPGSTGLNGTSFAAPVVSAYAAILHSKFQKATPTQISNQILKTAREDTIRGYDVEIHGQGEASLSRALSPKKIR